VHRRGSFLSSVRIAYLSVSEKTEKTIAATILIYNLLTRAFSYVRYARADELNGQKAGETKTMPPATDSEFQEFCWTIKKGMSIFFFEGIIREES